MPGYRAPAETIEEAGRTVAALARIMADAHAAGRLDAAPEPAGAPLDADAARVRDALEVDLPDDAVLRGVSAWTAVFGHVSFELFGQFENVIEQRDALFAAAADRLGRLAGL